MATTETIAEKQLQYTTQYIAIKFWSGSTYRIKAPWNAKTTVEHRS